MRKRGRCFRERRAVTCEARRTRSPVTSRSGQITLFLILAILIVFSFTLYYFIKKPTISQKNVDSELKEADIVKAYAETCLKMVTENALFNRIGLQGGYINPDGEALYGESGIVGSQISPPSTSILGKKLPYYLEASCEKHCHRYYCAPNPPPQPCTPTTDCEEWWCHWTYKRHILPIESIKEKLTKYIRVEFERCFNADVFKEIGIEVNRLVEPVTFDTSINEEDISVQVKYPLTIKRGETETRLDSFRVTLPIRLKALHKGAKDFVNNVENEPTIIDGKPHSPYTEPPKLPYDIRNDCSTYNKNGFTNVYVKNNDAGAKEIIQFVDFSTFYSYYFNSYLFQFALKNVDVNGVCAG